MIKLPLQLTRNWLYLLTTGFTIYVVLLPFSLLTYLKFYNTLIPESPPDVPFVFENNTATVQLPKTFDRLLDYEVSINFGLYCSENTNPTKVPYKILYCDETKTFSHTFILDTNFKTIYNKKNWLVPFALHDYVSPVLSNQDRYLYIALDKFVERGRHFITHPKLVIELGEVSGLIDDDTTFVRLIPHFTGFRWYLIKYYYTCLFAGTLFFWAISSFTSVVVSYSFLWVS